MSHPMRVRGLKHEIVTDPATGDLSHPMRVRGLKLYDTWLAVYGSTVAPHAGAWIETSSLWLSLPLPWSHPMRVRGLKQKYAKANDLILGRTPCGCVD